jgi:hypothetical protein
MSKFLYLVIDSIDRVPNPEITIQNVSSTIVDSVNSEINAGNNMLKMNVKLKIVTKSA